MPRVSQVAQWLATTLHASDRDLATKVNASTTFLSWRLLCDHFCQVFCAETRKRATFDEGSEFVDPQGFRIMHVLLQHSADFRFGRFDKCPREIKARLLRRFVLQHMNVQVLVFRFVQNPHDLVRTLMPRGVADDKFYFVGLLGQQVLDDGVAEFIRASLLRSRSRALASGAHRCDRIAAWHCVAAGPAWCVGDGPCRRRRRRRQGSAGRAPRVSRSSSDSAGGRR